MKLSLLGFLCCELKKKIGDLKLFMTGFVCNETAMTRWPGSETRKFGIKRADNRQDYVLID